MKNNKAFTLVELAIVLIIIGLITGGVVGAQSLIDSSARASQVKQITDLELAYNAFKLEYDAIPGDFDEAWDYWGSNCIGTQAQCNGNGDKDIGDTTSSPYHESALFWKHLELSTIIDGGFSGSLSGDPNLSFPLMKLGDVGHIRATESAAANCDLNTTGMSDTNKVYFTMGLYDSNAAETLGNIASKAVKGIDKKIDDELPNLGALRAETGTYNEDADCYTSTCVTSGAYNVSHNEKVCVMFYVLNK